MRSSFSGKSQISDSEPNLTRRKSEVANLSLQTTTTPKKRLHHSRSRSERSLGFISDDVIWDVVSDFKDHYICVKKLGEGAQAAAFVLSDVNLPIRQVVAKLYTDTPKNRTMVTNEIKVLKHLNKTGCQPFLLCFQRNFVCPAKTLSAECTSSFSMKNNVLVVVYDYFFGQGTKDFSTLLNILALDDESYQEMSPVEQDINSKISEHIISPDYQLQFIFTLIRSVTYLHENNVAHMDLKPSNIVVNINTGRLQLIDFGVSCMEQDCTPSGTLMYMAPEVVRSLGGVRKYKMTPISRRSRYEDTKKIIPIHIAYLADAWSIGVILFEYIHGQLPYDIPSDGLLYGLGKAVQEDIYNTNFEHYNNDVKEAINTVIDGFLQIDTSLRLSVIDANRILQPLMDTVLETSSSSQMVSPLSRLDMDIEIII